MSFPNERAGQRTTVLHGFRDVKKTLREICAYGFAVGWDKTEVLPN